MSDADKPRQLPLELRHAPGQSRDDLMVSAANMDAVALIDRWPDWPSPVIVLAGPPGAGKSHLAAIWREASGAILLPANAIRDREASGETALEVCVEDADRAGLDETGLFHLINRIRAGGGHLLLTARRFPAAWGVRLPDLASRLKAATTVEIHEPDDVLLAGVITKLFADRQVEVEPSVVQYVARRIERSLLAAIRAVEILDRLALERKSRITRVLAAEAIAALDAGSSGQHTEDS